MKPVVGNTYRMGSSGDTFEVLLADNDEVTIMFEDGEAEAMDIEDWNDEVAAGYIIECDDL